MYAVEMLWTQVGVSNCQSCFEAIKGIEVYFYEYLDSSMPLAPV